MIKLCKNLFYQPKYDSEQDSIMMRHLFSTVVIVLVCLAAISFSAYAFFSHSITSGTNPIQSANFSTTVTLKDIDGNPITSGKIDSYNFAPGQYIVTVTKDAETNGTGFCVIQVGDAKYYTQQLGKDLNAPGGHRGEVSFVLDVKNTAVVGFESRWGTTSYYSSAIDSQFYIRNAEPMTVVTIDGVQNILEDEVPSQDATTPTEPEETTPATEPTPTEPEETTPTEPEETTTPTDSEAEVYTVKPDETLFEIALSYNMSHVKVAAYNNIPAPYAIRPGDVIKIPPENWEMPTE